MRLGYPHVNHTSEYLIKKSQEGLDILIRSVKKWTGEVVKIYKEREEAIMQRHLELKREHALLVTDMTEDVLPQVKWNPEDLNHIRDSLVMGYKALKQTNANIIAISMDYGNYLNLAFDYFSLYKETSGIEPGVTFQHWLSDMQRNASQLWRKTKLTENIVNEGMWQTEEVVELKLGREDLYVLYFYHFRYG